MAKTWKENTIMKRQISIDPIELVAVPTDALREARRKASADCVLAPAEWKLVALFAHQSLEALAMTEPKRVSRDALLAVLDAFAAVYDLRQRPDTSRHAYYLGNLPGGVPAGATGQP